MRFLKAALGFGIVMGPTAALAFAPNTGWLSQEQARFATVGAVMWFFASLLGVGLYAWWEPRRKTSAPPQSRLNPVEPVPWAGQIASATGGHFEVSDPILPPPPSLTVTPYEWPNGGLSLHVTNDGDPGTFRGKIINITTPGDRPLPRPSPEPFPWTLIWGDQQTTEYPLIKGETAQLPVVGLDLRRDRWLIVGPSGSHEIEAIGQLDLEIHVQIIRADPAPGSIEKTFPVAFTPVKALLATAHVHDVPHDPKRDENHEQIPLAPGEPNPSVCHDCGRDLINDRGTARLLLCPKLHGRRPAELRPTLFDGAVECGRPES